MVTKKEKTPFELQLERYEKGELQTPRVNTSTGTIDYFKYQLAVHKFNISLMASGMAVRGLKLNDFKNYYGIKGRTAQDVKAAFMEIFEKHTK